MGIFFSTSNISTTQIIFFWGNFTPNHFGEKKFKKTILFVKKLKIEKKYAHFKYDLA